MIWEVLDPVIFASEMSGFVRCRPFWFGSGAFVKIADKFGMYFPLRPILWAEDGNAQNREN